MRKRIFNGLKRREILADVSSTIKLVELYYLKYTKVLLLY